MDIDVSVIIPVYNVENYLRQCLDSLLAQTLKNIEIICVDDGSTDKSLAILLEYKEKYPETFIVVSQKNSGAGLARNKGMEIARGRYLSFLDADDFFEQDMLSKSFQYCEANDLDFCVFRSDRYHNDSGKYEKIPWTIKNNYLPSQEVFSATDIQQYVFQIFNGWAWDKLYKRDFINKIQIKFQDLRTTNDAFFVFIANTQAERIGVIDEIYAHHRVSLTNSLSVTREKSWDCCLKAMIAIKEELIKRHQYEMYKRSYCNWALNFCLWNVRTLVGEPQKNLLYVLQKEYLRKLDLIDKKADFFYNYHEYICLVNIIKKGVNAVVNTKIQENILSKIYRFYQYCGLRATMEKIVEKIYQRI